MRVAPGWVPRPDRDLRRTPAKCSDGVDPALRSLGEGVTARKAPRPRADEASQEEAVEYSRANDGQDNGNGGDRKRICRLFGRERRQPPLTACTTLGLQERGLSLTQASLSKSTAKKQHDNTAAKPREQR